VALRQFARVYPGIQLDLVEHRAGHARKRSVRAERAAQCGRGRSASRLNQRAGLVLEALLACLRPQRRFAS
jgi:hypothetical protein